MILQQAMTDSKKWHIARDEFDNSHCGVVLAMKSDKIAPASLLPDEYICKECLAIDKKKRLQATQGRLVF